MNKIEKLKLEIGNLAWELWNFLPEPKKSYTKYYQGIDKALENRHNPEKLKELILQKEKEGKVVFMTAEGSLETDLEEFIKQPIEGLLYDLNRDRGTMLHFLTNSDELMWVNCFAASLVIKQLKKYYDSHPK